MNLGNAVELSATTKLIPAFNPEHHTFTVQLWHGYVLTATLGLEPQATEHPDEIPDCFTHEDEILDSLDDFLERHGLEPLTPLQEGALAEELIMAKGGADAELLRRAKQNPDGFLPLF